MKMTKILKAFGMTTAKMNLSDSTPWPFPSPSIPLASYQPKVPAALRKEMNKKA